jgi:hypothetical protein
MKRCLNVNIDKTINITVMLFNFYDLDFILNLQGQVLQCAEL